MSGGRLSVARVLEALADAAEATAARTRTRDGGVTLRRAR